MSGYSKTDASKDTESSTKDVSRAHHDARDDSGAREGNDKEAIEKAPSNPNETTESGTPLYPERVRD